MKAKSALAVMARFPLAGQVKTRLARTIGDRAATALYQAFLDDLDERFASGPRDLIWMVDRSIDSFRVRGSSPRRARMQGEGNLADRMLSCFRLLLCGTGDRAPEYEQVVMVGADIPHLREAWVDAAESLLANVDVVLGPSLDGGYYLIAMRQPHDLFSSVEMGQPDVCAATVARAHALGLRVGWVADSFDVDTIEDLSRLRNELDGDAGVQSPFTRSVLADLGYG